MAQTVLAIDTSTHRTALALGIDGKPTIERSVVGSVSPGQPRVAEVLLSHIDELVREGGRSPQDIDLVVVGIGPGSFTGVRVGVATAKGIALGSGCPIVGVLSHRVIAAGAAPEGGHVLVATEAYRGEVFCSLVGVLADGSATCVLDPFHEAPGRAFRAIRAQHEGPVTVVGAGARRYLAEVHEVFGADGRIVDETLDVPRGSVLVRLGLRDLALHGPSDLATLEPLYVRASDAKLPATPLKL